uniref:ubiquitinyl hydrolase 1 n=2 Tax=Mesocestoides corti TaxID=53468 RepID=A0A5K3ENB0_MESCO
MEIYKQNDFFNPTSLKWVLQQPWLTDNNRKVILAVVFGVSSVALGRISYPFFRRHFYSLWIASDNELPIGLINSRNLCYLNALLQAMASNRSLVKSLRRSAAVKRDRLLCSLVALLEGLSCCSGYLKRHQLVEVLTNAHKILIEELSLSGKWAVHDQQDAHELFGFFMDLANNYEAGRSAVRASEGLRSVSRLLIGKSPAPPAPLANGTADAASTNQCHKKSMPLLPLNLVNGGTKAVTLGTYQVPKVVPSFKHNLIASQIFCSRCSYRSDIKLVPESCLILFPKKSKNLHKKKKSGKSKAPYNATLNALLEDEFQSVERLMGINCPRCHMKAITVPAAMVNDPAPLVADKSAIKHLAEINCRNTCYVRRWIAHLPTSPLVLYLQRAVWTPQAYLAPDSDEFVFGYSSGGAVTKFQDHVDFPLLLDLAPYLCSGRASEAVLKKLETDSINAPTVKADLYTHSKKGRPPRFYVLRSVIVHQGNSFNSGHYVTYRCWRKGSRVGEFNGGAYESAEWLLTSDRYVGRVPFSSVKACQAYMLFYERVPETAGPPSPGNDSDDHDAAETSDGDDDDDDFVVNPGSNNEFLDAFEGYSRARRIRAFMSLACGSGEIN